MAHSCTVVGLQAVVYLPAQQHQGFQLTGSFTRRDGAPVLDLYFENQTGKVLQQFALKFNTNHLGLAPSAPLKVASQLHHSRHSA